MDKSKKCCVKGCEAVGQTVHRFPNPRNDMVLFNRWLVVLCIDELYSLPPEKVYNNKRVCFAHFEPSCKSPGNPALYRYAVPTIGVPVLQSCVAEEPLPSCRDLRTPVPGCSEVAELSTPLVAFCEDKVTESVGMLHSVDVRRQVDLTPKANKLYKTAVHYKKLACRRTKKCLNFKQRLEAAERYASAPSFEKHCMTSSAQKFLTMQLRETKNKPRGRHFTEEEKTFCLTLLKNSPKGYDLLHKLFTLPCKKTLTTYLSRMTLTSGINKKLFDVLEKKVIKF